MTSDQHALLIEAQGCANGLVHLLSNMADTPISALEPFELVMLMEPITKRLDQLVQDEE